ncbi:amino acid adenylation domain-containing protein [Sphingomonas bacterium]|uniref:amino acid adenylation domain-containing protein n=1 Tax=Sphingomonas bacterium TaxID=1895847 RepID=UPI00157593DD|nr:amino acid adenylation domain-containing protein [Sphingomonas bacterium]
MTQDDNTTSPGGTAWASIPDLFARHVRERSDALAVEAQGQQRSYAELAERVDLFAARLANRLVDGERLVGVCLARDVDLPAWLLAILTVGAAYWPIDPTLPPARLAPMLDDARPALIVASRRYADVVAGVDTPVLIAEDEVSAPPAPVFTLRPDTLAYVIFTSGSTGRPKGVEVKHGSLVALMATMALSPGFAAGERLLGFTRISFDLSVPDMFLPFFAGGSLALVELDVAADPVRLAAAFDEYRPDVAQGTPSTWRALIEAGWRGLPGLRILAGGEAVTRALAHQLLPRCAELWNMYGPTEATVWATSGRVVAGDDPVPIGRAQRGAVVHIAGTDLSFLPPGEVGEIVIGGGGVARGYRNRPDLTAERFVMLPGGGRAYRTGDLGRADEDGTLHCLGRLDDQVKIRGFRIELGDVEAALALHPNVAWCAVKPWTDPSGEPVLVGYLVPRAGASPGVRDLKAFLATRLTPYMVPDRIVIVAAMPLTPNGKVDRAALPDPVATALLPWPTKPSEIGTRARLAGIWSDLLGPAIIADDDDFFDLGGYSLMTVRLTRRIEAEFGVRLALIELMQHSTLAAMAARIDLGDDVAVGATMLLNTAGERPPLHWLDAGPLMRTIMRGLSPDQPAFALNTDAVDEEALGAGDLSIPAIAARLKARLLAVQPAGPYYLGGWCRWGIVAFELAQQLVDEGKTVGLLVLLDAERPGWRRQRLGLRGRVATWFGPLRPIWRTASDEPASFSQRVEVATGSYRAPAYDGDVLLIRPVGSAGDAGWGAVVDGRLAVEHTPGDHVSMVRGAPAQALAAVLDSTLAIAQQRPSPRARTVQAARAI